MALVTANGLTAFDFQMRRPRCGAWHADMHVDNGEPVTGKVALVIDDGFRTFKGTAVRTGVFTEVAQLRVVAGAGGLGLSATPRHYNSASIGLILGDLARDAGEQLAASVDAGVMGTNVDAWTTPAVTVGTVIGALLQAWAPAGTAWRMLPDGTLWVGPETWPGAGLEPAIYQIQENADEEASMVIHLDRPAIDPGTIFEGEKVSYVQDDVPHTGPVQCRLWFEDAKISETGRFRDAIAALVNSKRPKVDYRAMYWGKVVTQSGGTVDVEMEDSNVPGMAKVPIYNPAGMSQDGVVGGRVLIGWSWPQLTAYALAFDGGDVAERVIAATLAYLGGKIGAEPTLKGTTYRAAQQALHTAMTGTLNSMATACTGPLSPLQAGFTALATAIQAFEALAAGFPTAKARVL